MCLQFALFSQMQLLRFDAIRLCDSVHVESSKVRPNLHQSVVYKDSLKISVRLIENCGLDSKKGAVIHRNDTLILLWTENNFPIASKGVVYEKGTWFHPDSLQKWSGTDCDCYMELTYVLSGIKDVKNLSVYNRHVFPKDSMYRIFTPTFEMYEGDTINYTDSLGIKKGKWILFDSLNRIKSISLILNKYYTSEFESFEYYNNGKLDKHTLYRYKEHDFLMEEKYDALGILRERYCSNKFNFQNVNDNFDISYIEYFDEKGNLTERKLIDVQNNLYECGYFYE